jgi:hypothetical protein
VSRFGASLWAREPTPADVERVRATLTDAEFAVWTTMPRADRAEGLATLRGLPPAIAADEKWAAAALLHDAGKAESGLGTFGRVFATVRGHFGDPANVAGRSGTYLRHEQIGADLLAAAGARPEVVAWAGHHHDPARWPLDQIPEPVCTALAVADGEPGPGVSQRT